MAVPRLTQALSTVRERHHLRPPRGLLKVPLEPVERLGLLGVRVGQERRVYVGLETIASRETTKLGQRDANRGDGAEGSAAVEH